MAEERKNNLRLWFWRSSAVLLVLVFFVARYFLRDQLPVREVRVSHQEVLNTVSENGRVEPLANYEIHSPIASIIKAVYVTRQANRFRPASSSFSSTTHKPDRA